MKRLGLIALTVLMACDDAEKADTGGASSGLGSTDGAADGATDGAADGATDGAAD